MPDLKDIKWFTCVALFAVAISTYLELYWPWGLLFCYWAILSVLSGESFLVERLHRANNPVLFWTVLAMWFGFGVYWIYLDLAWRYTT